MQMQLAVKDANKGLFGRVTTKVRVTLKRNCEDCNTDISVTAAQMQSRTYPDTSHAATYKAGVCNNCSWERVHADGKDHFMELKDSILGGLTESQYQTRHGVAWNE